MAAIEVIEMSGLDACTRARETRERLNEAVEELRRLGDAQRGLVADYHGVHTGGSGGDAMAAMCARREEAQRKCDRLRKIYAAELLAANAALNALAGLRREVVYQYYIAGLSISRVARAVDRTPGTVKRLKREGARQLSETHVSMPEWYGLLVTQNDTSVIPL